MKSKKLDQKNYVTGWTNVGKTRQEQNLTRLLTVGQSMSALKKEQLESWTTGYLALILPREKFHLSCKEEKESQPSFLISELL